VSSRRVWGVGKGFIEWGWRAGFLRPSSGALDDTSSATASPAGEARRPLPPSRPHLRQVRPPHVDRLQQVAPQRAVRRREQLRQAGHDAALEVLGGQEPPNLQQRADGARRRAAELERIGQQRQDLARRDGPGDRGQQRGEALEEGVLLCAVLDCGRRQRRWGQGLGREGCQQSHLGQPGKEMRSALAAAAAQYERRLPSGATAPRPAQACGRAPTCNVLHERDHFDQPVVQELGLSNLGNEAHQGGKVV
jgi:hypothetical protein